MPRQQVINFRDVTPAADVWALAACLYHTFTGSYPRDFPRSKDPWQIVLQTEPVPIRRRDAGIPRPLAEVVDGALREKPQSDFRTADAFRDALLALSL